MLQFGGGAEELTRNDGDPVEGERQPAQFGHVAQGGLRHHQDAIVVQIQVFQLVQSPESIIFHLDKTTATRQEFIIRIVERKLVLLVVVPALLTFR